MLQIARVQQEDAGRYKCQAVNEAGEDHMHFELEILSKSRHLRCNSHFGVCLNGIYNIRQSVD